MIAKKVSKSGDRGEDFTRLGEYIAAAKETGEKLDQLWMANCAAGDSPESFEAALAEIEAVRQLKGGKGDWTYHLIVSFRDGERESLTPDNLKEIAQSYADALGFDDHQYVAGTHINTDNFHMHVAFNKIHPVTGRVHTPYRDFKVLEKTSRAMETQFGLAIDRGMSDRGEDPEGLSPAALDYESETWEVSFQRWMIENKEPLKKILQQSRTWAALHASLQQSGVVLKRRGAGLVFADLDGRHTMKASSFDRSASLRGLEKRLGAFGGPNGTGEDPVSEETSKNGPSPDKDNFEHWIRGNKANLIEALQKSATWRELHTALRESGVQLKKRGAGVVFADLGGQNTIKASSLDRNASKKKLEERLGPFLGPNAVERPVGPDRGSKRGENLGYRQRPLLALPSGGTALWDRYIVRKRSLVPRVRGLTARNWKAFLLTEAHTDPLAFVIVVANREMMNLFLGVGTIAPGAPRTRANAGNGIARTRKQNRKSAEIAKAEVRFIEQGSAPFENKPGSSQSYFVTVERDNGKRHTIWGVDLKQAMIRANPKPGAAIRIEHTGTTPVRLPNGKIVERNSWVVENVIERDISRKPGTGPARSSKKKSKQQGRSQGRER